MSEIDEPLPFVNVVNKKWVDFDKAPVEQMVDGAEINRNHRKEDAAIRSSNKEDSSRNESNREPNREPKESKESTNIHLPPPPRPDRARKISNKSNQGEPKPEDRLHSSRSSTPYLSSSPSSASKIANHQPNHGLDAGRSSDRPPSSRADRLTDRPSARPSSRQSDPDRSTIRDELALNIPESFIKTNSANLQNVPLRDLAPTGSVPSVPSQPSNAAQSSSRFSEYSFGHNY